MKQGWRVVRGGWLAGAVGLGAAAVLLFDALVLWPAWRDRAEMAATVKEQEIELSRQRQAAAAIPAARERLAAKRQVVLAQEAALVRADADTSLIRQVEELAAGEGVAVTRIQAGEVRPLQRKAAEKGSARQKGAGQEQSPYTLVPYEIEAVGDREALMTFLAGLEGRVTGLRPEGAQLEAAPGQGGGWELTVTGSLYRVETTLPD